MPDEMTHEELMALLRPHVEQLTKELDRHGVYWVLVGQAGPTVLTASNILGETRNRLLRSIADNEPIAKVVERTGTEEAN